LRLGLLACVLVAALSGGPRAARLSASVAGAGDRCARLAQVRDSNLQIVSARMIPAGPYEPVAGTSFQLPGSCRVTAVATPTEDSRVGFELWLPDGWNGRYVQLGNGGFAGNIDQPSLANEIRRGNAAAMTDTGHKGSQFDASWAPGHPERVIDYGYRSIKVTAEAARMLMGDYYGRAARRRYFIGCSNGGRQALIAAQRFPNDWDGVLAGSPALEWTKQLGAFAAIQHRLRLRPENWIPSAKLPLIQRAAVAVCGRSAALGRACKVDVHNLICRGKDRPHCLTRAQASTLDLIQSGPTGFQPIGAAIPNNWDQWILNSDRDAPSDLTFATQAFRYLILDRPDWRVEDFDAQGDFVQASARKVAGYPLSNVLDADDADLSRFQRHGGKLILYVGWSDAVISPLPAVTYYRKLMLRMGTSRTQGFARLFVAPGMQHCQGGIAPNAFGQAWVAPALRADAGHDIRLALEDWVEHGRAPNSLLAATYRGDRGAGGVVATQRLRFYPAPAGVVRKFAGKKRQFAQR
jgi:hypothetical protein